MALGLVKRASMMIQKLKNLHLTQSSKTLYLGLPHTGLARSWELLRPQHATAGDTLGCDKLQPRWSLCCWEGDPDVQGGFELSDLNSCSFTLKGKPTRPSVF